MLKSILESLLQLGVVIPIIVLFMNRKEIKSYQLLGLFCIYFLLNQILLLLPFHFKVFDFFEGSWNWCGKIYAIIGSLLFYYGFRKHFYNNDFLRVQQTPSSLKINIAITVFIGTAALLAGLFVFSAKELSVEQLAYQFVMPGLEEEIAYRGIMLGILLTLFKNDKVDKPPIAQPAIWVTVILFALIHTLRIESLSSMHITNNWPFFFLSIPFGYILGWMTLKSRSILMPIFAHNAANFFKNLAMMLK